ncbi:MarR family transcriptional regulator [Rubrobacter taiwanensis]|jgi:DNA-binding MarR family transcriptional regulator|uniref:MarR family transcriptional regulator n=1 Tax=Rubrobacter taiwanensis TaxID=185139 RepID=A0A4V6NB54_9ACTN|nr:MarR family transcriptional regulator [Rubrobacter taiwanensis]TCJ20492.1 MarR family transcriptional regulator [Rubrobacter taiwanensis]
MGRQEIVDEILMLLPVLGRELGRPSAGELEEIVRCGLPVDVQLSTGHIQALIALSRGPRSVGELAEAVGVSRPAMTQILDRLEGHGMVRRRPHPGDRRVVLVEYVPVMREVAARLVNRRRAWISRVVDRMSEEEARAFLKGLKMLVAASEE